MIDYSDLIQPDKGQDAHAIHLVDKQSYDEWLKGRSARSEEHTCELQSRENLVCRLLLEKKTKPRQHTTRRRPNGSKQVAPPSPERAAMTRSACTTLFRCPGSDNVSPAA